MNLPLFSYFQHLFSNCICELTLAQLSSVMVG